MKYIFILIIPFLLCINVFASVKTDIFDTITSIDTTSENNQSFNSLLNDNIGSDDIFNNEMEVYFDSSGDFLGIIQERSFGIIFDNDESLIVALDPIEDRTNSGIKQAIISDKEKYVKSACLARHEACEYTKEGYRKVEEPKVSFFQKIKAFFYNIFLSLFSYITPQKEENFDEIFAQIEATEKEKLQENIWMDFFDYRENKGKKGYDKEKSLEIRNNIAKLIANADSLADIMNLRSLIDEYCYEENQGKGYESVECQKLKNNLKEKGDELKEKLFADIDTENKDALAKLIQLRSLLMAQERASKGTIFAKGETDEWFSTANVAKINKGIREKAQKWWKKHLEQDCSLQDIWQWHVLALAYETASGEYQNSSSIFGKYGGQLIQDVKRKAAGLVAANLIEIDICNPDLQKLEQLMNNLTSKDDKGNQIYKNGCQKLLPKSACDALKKKDLQTAYSILFYNANFDENNSKSLPAPPINCEKEKDVLLEDTEAAEIIDINGKGESNIAEIGKDNEIDVGTDEEVTTEEQRKDICTLIIFEDELIGWDYQVENCLKDHDEGLVCWERCGFMPPLVIKNEQTNECYEVFDGHIDEDLIIPCSPRIMPLDDGVKTCVKNCLME